MELAEGERGRSANDSAELAARCARELLALRAASGETQKQVAARLKMTESMVSRLERGDHVPSLKTLCRIAAAFGRRLEIVFHAHEHRHAGDASRSHPRDHRNPAHRHRYGDE
jgi:transcriptional regulator with XRE-family HTH domain